jgi:hypothetical protein
MTQLDDAIATAGGDAVRRLTADGALMESYPDAAQLRRRYEIAGAATGEER